MSGLTHFNAKGEAHMVDVSEKEITSRVATATGWVRMSTEAFEIISSGRAKKGDVLSVAQLAGIMGAKKTPDLIPLCHPLPIAKVALDLELDAALPGVQISATVKTTGQTGVEMEALTAVSTAALTVYDMIKAVDKTMEIGGIHVTLKDGGKSGRFEAK
ncbi:cyclic pyranopterin phosphate synthase [Planktotalea frisia]|uniref:Cyclic pyranopterin monophosphate synthase n=1 Tax=Planktotalea frisia TaxID=696762 RepID=A0A1L9NY12_9RHOB|nr:cyclic pyranopterin monophosphate synthase MoaC [Planktotalea frisia]OJI94176.1 cyclic pyranopterin monophosphate synthase accessory protein [Planktotalea frisia]PZX29629.1 cyclic pyranopterin phosphate synthase [Planktotalea frisia]